MYDNYNYPVGADTPRAPWNQDPLEPMDVEVTASNTLSKAAKVSVADYTYEGCDEEGYPCYDYKNCNLNKAWSEQHFTAKEALDLAEKFAQSLLSNEEIPFEIRKEAQKVVNACSGWDEDELEVVL